MTSISQLQINSKLNLGYTPLNIQCMPHNGDERGQQFHLSRIIVGGFEGEDFALQSRCPDFGIAIGVGAHNRFTAGEILFQLL
jgi:hypothetical protein